ncbi:MAG: ribosomal protein S18-alanine N-acetyltransferase [Chloroflexi bacterium]|nr:ribosomal protein S18-alanine N-acetyltransferase [Chloroflexota bacterium]
MDVVNRQPKLKKMAYGLRPMEAKDIPQVAEIERDAFPTTWPPTAFKRELNNPTIRYLVTWQREDIEGYLPPTPPPPKPSPKEAFISRLFRSVTNVRPSENHKEEDIEYLTGFVGIWFMVDEAHITAIGVREAYRGRGIGELLLIGAIDMARARSSRIVTLEVRVSNNVAQSLYNKYGFSKMGLRKRYYVDNNEDAIVMSTSPILDPPYSEKFQQLVQAHREHWGRTIRVLS